MTAIPTAAVLACAVAILAGCAPTQRATVSAPRAEGPAPITAAARSGAREPSPPSAEPPPGGPSSPAAPPVPPSHPAAPEAPVQPLDRRGLELVLPPPALPGWHRDDLAGLGTALERQCASRRPPAPWPALCAEFKTLQSPLEDWIARRFVARALADDTGGTTGLITGYHEPQLHGSLVRESPGQVPLYRRPPDVVLQARPTRARIETSGLLAGSELVWLDDPVEAFFLHVQGSGRVRLRDGRILRVGYAGDNGLGYRAIGAELVARGALALPEVDAGRIKAWLRANPAQAQSVMHANPRFIFFRELPPAPQDAGPPGSIGVPLTPMRSVAIDPKRVPPGALLWLDTTDPLDGAPLRRLVVAQDTGAAIVGTVRADLFWGTGERAEQGAGLMKQAGRLWLLEPKP